MRNVGLVLALVGGLGLGGCATTPDGTPTVDVGQIQTVLTQAQQDAAKICGFIPTIGTVASIAASFFPGAQAGVDIGNQIATMVCNAVAPPKSLKRRAGAPMVGDVKVEGYFIR